MKWNEEEISRVEDVYIGMWAGVPGGPKLKAFIDAAQRFSPDNVIKAIEHIARTQDHDRRPAIKTIMHQALEFTPRQRKRAPEEEGGSSIAFTEYIDGLPDSHPIKIMLRKKRAN